MIAVESILSQTFQDLTYTNDNGQRIIQREISTLQIKKSKLYTKIILLNSANNVALNFARGEFIIRLDADDYFHKDALKVLSRKLESNKNLN